MKKISIKRHRTLLEIGTKGFLYFLMLLLGLLYIFPVFIAILYSLKDKLDFFNTGPLDFPTHFYLGNYLDGMKQINIVSSLTNSLIITVTSVLVLILVSLMASWGIARGTKKISKIMYGFFIAGLLIPGQALFVPTYLVGSKLGLVGSLPGVIFFYIAGNIPFAVFMLTSFLRSIPGDIEEADVIDGAGMFRILFTIVLPLLKPAIVTLAVLRSLLIWNDFLLPSLFLTKNALMTMTVKISNLFGTYRYNLNISFAAMILSSIPIIIFFVINQKNIEKGIMVGAVKG